MSTKKIRLPWRVNIPLSRQEYVAHTEKLVQSNENLCKERQNYEQICDNWRDGRILLNVK